MPNWLIGFGFVALGAGLVVAALLAGAIALWLLRQLEERQAAIHAQAYARARVDADREARTVAMLEARVGQRAALAEAKAEGRAEVLNQRTTDEKRGKAHWGAAAVAEIGIDDGNKLAEDLQVVTARLENSLLRMEWLRNGGSPTAGWAEIVNWKNKKDNTK